MPIQGKRVVEVAYPFIVDVQNSIMDGLSTPLVVHLRTKNIYKIERYQTDTRH
jgi:hypothetical protein